MEAEEYLLSAHRTCTGFELMVVTSTDPRDRHELRERLRTAGATLKSAPPSAELLRDPPKLQSDDGEHVDFVYWIEAENEPDSELWREFAVLLNRARERLRDQHRYLWVLSGPLALRRIMTQHAQDIYSGAYKAPHVTAHPNASLTWLHLSDLQLGTPDAHAVRQGGDVWTTFDALMLPDLHRSLDTFEVAPDLVLVSGDLGLRGRPEDYAQVDRFMERLLAELEGRTGVRPILLAVPGNHDVRRPIDPLEHRRLSVLRHHDGDDPSARSLREHLWQRKDTTLIEPLFSGYGEWMKRRVLEPLQPDEIGLEPGRVHLRSVTTSHIPGDWSVVVEKDDFRLGLVGLNTAWRSLDDEHTTGTLALEQLGAALGPRGLYRLDEAMHQCILVTHHGPEALSLRSSLALTRFESGTDFAAHLCGPSHERRAQAITMRQSSSLLPGYPTFAWGLAPRGPSSGYRLGRIRRDGHIESLCRVLEPIPARGSWRYVDDDETPELRASPAPPSPTADQELARYLTKIESLHRPVQLAGPEARIRVPIELHDLRVLLGAVIDRSASRRTFGSALEADEALHDDLSSRGHELSLSEAFGTARELGRRGIVLLGDPGSGKTTHLEQLLLQSVREGPESLGLPAGTVPIYLPLRRMRDFEAGLSGFIEQELADPRLAAPPGFGRRLSERGKLLLLLDGLDEVPDAEDRRRVSRWIEDICRAAPTNFFLVTSRYAGYSPDSRLDANFLELHLRPLDSDQLETFIRRWYSLVETADGVDHEQDLLRVNARADDLITTLRQPEMRSIRVYGMIHNPTLLAAICLVHRDRGELPKERVVLYQGVVSVLLERWRESTERLAAAFPDREALHVLQPVAWWIHQQEGRFLAKASELEEPISKGLEAIAHESLSARQFLETIRDQSGLFTGWGTDVYGFMHMALQEYLAAREIQSRVLGGDPLLLPWLAERFDSSWWSEVILLMLALEPIPMFPRFMSALVERPEFPQWAGSEMMRRCWAEAFGASEVPFVKLLKETSGDPTLGARQRAAAQLLARYKASALDGMEDVLREHPSEEVRAWWHARSRDPAGLDSES